jgi:hypothetical protein
LTPFNNLGPAAIPLPSPPKLASREDSHCGSVANSRAIKATRHTLFLLSCLIRKIGEHAPPGKARAKVLSRDWILEPIDYLFGRSGWKIPSFEIEKPLLDFDPNP